jgi:hypothetical protein
MWEEVEKIYGTPGALSSFLLFKDLFWIQFSESESLNKQIEDALALRNKAVNAGITVTDDYFIYILLLALPPSYLTLVTSLLQRTSSTSKLTVEDVRKLIVEDETMKAQTAGSLAAFNKGKAPSGAPRAP